MYSFRYPIRKPHLGKSLFAHSVPHSQALGRGAEYWKMTDSSCYIWYKCYAIQSILILLFMSKICSVCNIHRSKSEYNKHTYIVLTKNKEENIDNYKGPHHSSSWLFSQNEHPDHQHHKPVFSFQVEVKPFVSIMFLKFTCNVASMRRPSVLISGYPSREYCQTTNI